MTSEPSQTRLALGAMLIPLFFVTAFALCIIGVYHKPHPHDIALAVVGPPAQTAPVRAGLARVGGSAFAVSSIPTAAEATHAVRQREVVAAFVPSPNPRQPSTAIVARAGGRLVATVTETFLRDVTAARGGQLVVRDVRPLPPGDPIGVGLFMFMIVCTICGYLAATLLFTVAPDLPPSRRYSIIAAMAVLIPAIAYLIGGLGFGTFTGSFGTILAFVGLGAVYAFVIGLITRLLQVLLGPPALFVSLAIFVFLNIPSLGATYTPNILPGFWRFLNHFWIGAETTDAARSTLYFGGQDVGGDLLRLLAWTGVVVALLLLPVSRKRARPVAVRAVPPPAPRLARQP